LQPSKQDEGGYYEKKGVDLIDGGNFRIGYFWMRWGESDDQNRSLSNSTC
jgi:hypothetical protein